MRASLRRLDLISRYVLTGEQLQLKEQVASWASKELAPRGKKKKEENKKRGNRTRERGRNKKRAEQEETKRRNKGRRKKKKG